MEINLIVAVAIIGVLVIALIAVMRSNHKNPGQGAPCPGFLWLLRITAIKAITRTPIMATATIKFISMGNKPANYSGKIRLLIPNYITVCRESTDIVIKSS